MRKCVYFKPRNAVMKRNNNRNIDTIKIEKDTKSESVLILYRNER